MRQLQTKQEQEQEDEEQRHEEEEEEEQYHHHQQQQQEEQGQLMTRVARAALLRKSQVLDGKRNERNIRTNKRFEL